MSALVLPPGRVLNTADGRAIRLAMIEEAISWPGLPEAPAETWVYQLLDQFAVGVRKPGKEANPSRRRPNPHDMLPLVKRLNVPLPFDAGFNDIFRALYNIGSLSRQSRQEEAARTLGAVLFRAAWVLDHQTDGEGRFRLRLGTETESALVEMPSLRVYTPTASHDVPAFVLLHFLEVLALNEDIKYWARLGGSLTKTGRPSTFQTCARALACGLGLEHPMDFAYGLSRGNGVASLSRVTAVSYFPELHQ